MQTQFSQIPKTLKSSKVKINIELTSDINISSFVARQKANVFLLTRIGNLLSSGEPKLSVNDGNLRWLIPVIYTLPKQTTKQVAELVMDVNSGEIILHESNPSTIKEIEEYVQHIYRSTS